MGENTMKVLDLFSGLGGFSLGLERTGKYKTVAFCEMDKYCKLVLQKHWKGAKIYNDVKEITKARFEADGIEFPEVITGGFPCQPFSVAGKRQGTSDDRHLWPEMFRIIKEFKPRWVIGENVKGLINLENGMVFETVCTDLEGEGYEVRAFNIPAAGVGAPHRRERIWIVANSRRTLRQGSSIREKNEDETRKEDADQHQRSSSSPEPNVANAESIKSREQTQRQGWENSTRRSIDSRGDSKKRSEDNVANANINGTERNQPEDRKGRRTQQSSEDVANTNSRLSDRENEEVQSGGQTFDTSSEGSTDVANTESSNRDDNETISGDGESQTQEISRDGSSLSGEGSWWHVEPDVGRVAHGVPGRVHRLKALGNSIVPKIAEEIGKAIIEADNEME